jgi:hypothetical protein
MMRLIEQCREHLTYANIIATVALFIGLGGASYAAVALPPGSVGSKQLRVGAVTPNRLGFPLGTVGITDDKAEDLIKGACNGGGEFLGSAAPACTPGTLGGPTPGREVHISLRSSGRLLVSGTVNLKNEGDPQTTARITLQLDVDRRPVSESQTTIPGGQAVQIPIQTLANVPVGMHTAGLAVKAEYNSSTPGDVIVSSASVIASALPGFESGR